jgi:hypothetical protein
MVNVSVLLGGGKARDFERVDRIYFFGSDRITNVRVDWRDPVDAKVTSVIREAKGVIAVVK